MENKKIVVIGAGMSGLTTAMALLKSGHQVDIYETAPELGEVGAGLTLSPNANCVLKHLGVGDAVYSLACHPETTTTFNGLNGDVITRSVLGDVIVENFGARYIHIHRADLHKILADAVEAIAPSAIHTGHTFDAYTETTDGVNAHFAEGQTASGDLLIGADGIRSAVREEMFGAENPTFTGNIAWRGLVPMDLVPDSVPNTDTCVNCGPGRLLIHYPVRNGELLNFAALVGESEWTSESWNEHADMSEALEAFRDFIPRVKDIITATPPEMCFIWGLYDRPSLEMWSRGRVTLLGDAAHPMLPYLGSGAGMGIEDGMVLARCIDASDDHEEVYTRYEAARKERAEWVCNASREAGLRFMDKNATEETLRVVPQQGPLFAYNAVTAEI